MLNFNFKNQTEILFGQGQIAEAKKRLPENAKVLFLYGGGSIKKNGIYDDVIELLDGVEYAEFSGVEANPTLETLLKAIALVKEKELNFILAVGGGSVIDGAKFVAAGALFDGNAWDIVEKDAFFAKALPIGCILTLPATGSESNSGAVITRKETQQKLPFHSSLVQPAFAVLDPVYTYSLPTKQISNGVVDAFVHVVEQYLTYPVNAPLQDRFSEGILSTLLEEGPKALAEPTNYNVRANIMWSATMALNGLIGKGVPQDWATHMIGHEFTVLYGLDHAQTLAIVLPYLMNVQRVQKKEKLLQMARRVFAIQDQSDETTIDLVISRVQEFFETMGVQTHLSDYQLDLSAVKAVVKNLERNNRLTLGEHGDINPAKVTEILTLAL
ncbi:UNVERIFIED_CONTAM: hypothetical protein GTU68_036766 [Idotea baltica]|nr:hypothetical protein [Idotea baltica]